MRLTVETYCEVRARLAALGYVEDWEWAQNVKPPETAEALACEYTWVVLNSGMKNSVARKIMDRVWPALVEGIPLYGVGPACGVAKVFGHRAKAEAIERGWRDRACWLVSYREAARHDAPAVLEWCESLPWIGPITKCHLAKNLGVDCAKPDRWLVRLAAVDGETVDGLCRRLAEASGDRIATVDVVLWRACAIGVVSVTGSDISISDGPHATGDVA